MPCIEPPAPFALRSYAGLPPFERGTVRPPLSEVMGSRTGGYAARESPARQTESYFLKTSITMNLRPPIFALLLTLGLVGAGCQSAADDHAHGPDTHTHDTGAAAADHGGPGHTHADGPAFTYLKMDGDFEMDPELAATRDDPRNPSRIRLATSSEAGSGTRMAFYAHDDPDQLVADCGYQFVGSRPDPHYFPAESKTSIWDVFERTEAYDGACEDYAAVISRSPHGDPAHMHLRYGTDADELLAMSDAPVDSAAFDPWWPVFCEAGVTESCD